MTSATPAPPAGADGAPVVGKGEAGSDGAGPAAPVRVRSVSRHRLVQELAAREHRWLSDRPRGRGGDGLGPTPLEVLLGGFAAATAVGVLGLAREKAWAVDAVEVEVSQHGDDETPGPEMQRVISVKGELTDDERRELQAEVAARWPRAAWLPAGTLRDKFSYR